MIAYYLPGGTYTWMISAHHYATRGLFSSAMSVGGLVFLYALSCAIRESYQGGMDTSSQRDVVTEYLLNNKDASQEEITFCAYLLAALPDPNSQRTIRNLQALVNLFVSFCLGLMILMVITAISLIFYPRRTDSEEENFEERRASRGFRLLTLGLMLRRYHVVSAPS